MLMTKDIPVRVQRRYIEEHMAIIDSRQKIVKKLTEQVAEMQVAITIAKTELEDSNHLLDLERMTLELFKDIE